MSLNPAASINIGHELSPRVKQIAQRQIDAYSGVRPKSIHTDVEWAKKKGFAAPLAQGLMSTAYVSQMMVDLLGEGFVRGGKINVAFIKPVLAGDTLTMHGVVKSKAAESDKTRVTVEFWCESQRGEKTLVGTASGLAA
jgi:acyl dehydratase